MAFNEGHQEAFAEIYQRYWLQMFNHARRMLKDPDQASDAVQEVFTKVLEKRGSLVIKTSLAAFVYQGLRNHIINLVEHEKVKALYLQRLQHFQNDGSWSTDERVRANELEALIEKEISLLPEKMRETFILSRNEELSYKEIAARMDISEGTVKKQVYYALKILKGKLSFMLVMFKFF
ncbi:RNA polymerase sigma-70 factor [Chitinophaga sp. Ak27]|nr:RNA polymerase sigma-70 factor [Chitinophaga sp. Ak27]